MRTEDRDLLNEARKAVKKAYAPYSEFKVGAALILDNGITVTGNNQENAAYPSGLCAERTAVFYASSQYPNAKIKSIAISYESKNKNYSFLASSFNDGIYLCVSAVKYCSGSNTSVIALQAS